MRVSFIGQGFENLSPNAVGNKLVEFLGLKSFDTFFGISAFASAAGVKGLSSHINNAKAHFRSLNIIVGIDQYGTSKEALEEIDALNIHGYVFYQNESPIFHPKIYLFEGLTEVKLILGSSNFTSKGLFNNVESSLLIEFDSNDTDGVRLLTELKTYYSSLFNLSDPNLFKINPQNINSFELKNLVIKEPKRIMYQGKKTSSLTTGIAIPTRQVSKIPADFRINRKSTHSGKISIVHTSSTGDEKDYERSELVWVRKNLPASSVQLSTGNPTGGLRLVQDGFMINGHRIDHTTYFRNIVFGSLNWNQITANPFGEVAKANFFITIKGSIWGLYELEVRHKPSGEAGQGNYTTLISWGEIGDKIKNAALTNSKLELYSPKSIGDPFQIEIK